MPTTPPCFTDTRLAQAACMLAAGKIELLALDVFDTLLGRIVPKPPDVFLRLGQELLEENCLGPGLLPDSFAALRYHTEYEARNRRQRKQGDREITLAEIYALMPRQTSSLSAAELAARELAVEDALCFADPEIVKLAVYARALGLKLALISNTYFAEKDLLDLIRAKAPELPTPDAVFVSCAHRRGKRTGLIPKMLKETGVEASACLLVGDNPVSDKLAAEEQGVPCLFLGPLDDDFQERLAAEHPVQWHARTARFGHKNGDFGLTWLRRKAEHWRAPEAVPAAHYRYGATMMGPLLAGFASWVHQRALEQGAPRVFGLLREAETLLPLMQDLGGIIPTTPLAVSRYSVALASFHPDYPEHLEDFLTRSGYWTVHELLGQLGFSASDSTLVADPQATLQELGAPALTQRLLQSSLAGRLFEESAARRERLLLYLNNVGALDLPVLYLCDLGYAATIQRGLQRIFKIEGKDIQTHGFYLATAHVSRATQWEGGLCEGFLAQNGNPNDFARAFCRSPEIVELSCMPSYGSVKGYAADGSPLFEENTFPARQLEEIAAVQQGARAFAQRWHEMVAALASSPNFGSAAWVGQMRDLATRLVVYPTQSEARLMGHWVSVAELGRTDMRPIISAGPHAAKVAEMNGAQLAALPRRDVPWLYGLAASLSHRQAREAAAIMMRTETPESYQ